MPVRDMGQQTKTPANKNQSIPQPSRHAREDLMQYVRDYARENPEATALWCLGIGFVLGWKLKPW